MARFNKNHERQYGPGEINFLPSLTVPDQVLSIRQIMDRFSRGLPIDGEQFAVYHGEDFELPDFSRMDLAEIQEYREKLTHDNNVKRAKLQEQWDAQQATKRQEAAKAAAERAKFQKWLATQPDPESQPAQADK